MERKGDAGVEVKELERVESASEKDLELSRTTSVDSAHYDEALKILEDHIKNGGEESWTEQEEKRLRRKVDWRLIPVVCLSYGLQAYDKAMLSQAVSISVLKLEHLVICIMICLPNAHECRLCLAYGMISGCSRATATPSPHQYSSLDTCSGRIRRCSSPSDSQRRKSWPSSPFYGDSVSHSRPYAPTIRAFGLIDSSLGCLRLAVGPYSS